MKARISVSFACAAIVAAALVLSGCFGGGGGNDEGVAAIAPPDASLYADADLKPEGDAKENLDSFLSAMLETDDPGQKITDLIDQGFESQSEPRNFENDVKPWLGDTGGVFTVGYQNNPPAVVAVQSDDTDQGVELLRSESQSVTDKEYKGVKYQLNDDGDAFGAIDDFVAQGDETAYKAAIDASQGNSLADSDAYKKATDDVSGDALGTGYLNLKALIGQVAQEQGIPSGTAEDVATKLGIGNSLVLSADSAPKAIGLDISGLGGLGDEAPALLGKLPGDTTFAVGLSDVGGKVKSLVDSIETAGIPGVGKGTIAAAVQSQTDLDINQDLFSWIGDAAFFIRGSDPSTADGALVIQSKDDHAAAATMEKLRQLVQSSGMGSPKSLEFSPGNGFQLDDPNFSQPLNFVQTADRFVIGVGQDATQAALAPSDTLAKSPSFTAASGSLGDAGPAFYASIPDLVGLIGARPNIDAAQFEQLKPYLDRLAYLTAGGSDGGVKLVLGAK
jgi:Protein of unknown function (DUF3352)